MKDRTTQSDDWIGDWIARQRETLMRNAAPAQNAPNPADMLRKWLDAGQAYFDGLKSPNAEGADATGGAAAFADPFGVSTALLSAWSNAGVFQSGAAQQTADWFGRLPPIGLAREHTEAWRELAEAHARCQQIETELRAVLLKVQFDALDLLGERAASERIESFRALYDLWVECGEQVYGKLAHSEEYSRLQAELGNATMRVRARMQTVIEHGLKQFDLPTRSELNSLHRQVRELRSELERVTAPPAATGKPKRAAPRSRAKRKTKTRRK